MTGDNSLGTTFAGCECTRGLHVGHKKFLLPIKSHRSHQLLQLCASPCSVVIYNHQFYLSAFNSVVCQAFHIICLAIILGQEDLRANLAAIVGLVEQAGTEQHPPPSLTPSFLPPTPLTP